MNSSSDYKWFKTISETILAFERRTDSSTIDHSFNLNLHLGVIAPYDGLEDISANIDFALIHTGHIITAELGNVKD